MRYLALACDYDGTLAQHGQVDARTREALGRLRKSGRRLLLVTGRELDDLRRVCPDLEPFDLIVAENGAVLYEPRTRSRPRSPSHRPRNWSLPSSSGAWRRSRSVG
jgi:HAD superfamily hydrolase (TIGR01484 family)